MTIFYDSALEKQDQGSPGKALSWDYEKFQDYSDMSQLVITVPSDSLTLCDWKVGYIFI